MISQVTLGFHALTADLLKAQHDGRRCLSIAWHWSKGKATVTYWVKEQGELFETKGDDECITS